MRKLIYIGVLMAIGLVSFSSFSGAASKVKLEEIVMQQEMEIDGLKAQLADTSKRLEALEKEPSNTNESLTERMNSAEKNINTLMKIHNIDEKSILNYVENLPTHYRRAFTEYYFSIEPNVLHLADDVVIGSEYYNILDYISISEIQEIVKKAYYESKHKDSGYTTVKIYYTTPDKTRAVLDVPLK